MLDTGGPWQALILVLWRTWLEDLKGWEKGEEKSCVVLFPSLEHG